MKKIGFLFLLIFVSCSMNHKKNLYTKTEMFMDTIVTITVIGDEKKYLKKSVDDTMEYMRNLSDELTVHSSNNLMYKINHQGYNHDIQITTNIYNVLKEGLCFSHLSDGFFDITIYPLIQIWDFKKAIVPDSSRIQQTLKEIDYKNIQLTNDKIRLLSEHTEIDTGGVAKGYIIDKAYQYLKKQNIQSGLVNVGGDIYAWGTKQNQKKWVVGIQDPRNSSRYVKIVKIKDEAIVTSGDYERYFIKNGHRYHHIINAKTGYPDTDIMSVTIIASNAVFADGLSTTVMVMGSEKGIALLQHYFSHIKYLIIYKKNGKRRMISNFK